MTEARKRELRIQIHARATAVAERASWVLRGSLDEREVMQSLALANQLVALWLKVLDEGLPIEGDRQELA
jgi:hypothetical protein